MKHKIKLVLKKKEDKVNRKNKFKWSNFIYNMYWWSLVMSNSVERKCLTKPKSGIKMDKEGGANCLKKKVIFINGYQYKGY